MQRLGNKFTPNHIFWNKLGIRHHSRTALYPGHVALNLPERIFMTVGSATLAITDPNRHDMVAALSETTSGPFLEHLRKYMRSTISGRRLLREKPRITEASLAESKLEERAPGTLGRTYVDWLRACNVTPDTRDPVRYVNNAELAYVLQRYRECHDFYHVLLGFPVHMSAEIVVKWFEAANLHLPMAMMASIAGPLRMSTKRRRRLANTYLNWALTQGERAKCLIDVEWERHWDTPIDHLRSQLDIQPPPVEFRDWLALGRKHKLA